MKKNPNSEIILLLTAHFSGRSGKEERPLSVKEWASLASFLYQNMQKGVLPKEPSDLSEGTGMFLDQVESETGLSKKRLDYLLHRGSGLAIMKAKWEQAALWCITRADDEYPQTLKKRLGLLAPPVIYGCGDKQRLRSKILGLLGSIDQYPNELLQSLSSKGFAVLPEVLSKLSQVQVPVIGIVSGDLIREATSLKYRDAIRDNLLTLICFSSPEIGKVFYKSEKYPPYYESLVEQLISVKSSKEQDNSANNIWMYFTGFVNTAGKIVTADRSEELFTVSGGSESGNQINRAYQGESGDLLTNEDLLDPKMQEILKKDKFHQFMISLLDKPVTFDELVQIISSDSLNKTAIKKWLKLAEERGCVRVRKRGRKKTYVRC